jgi:F0F1-type ATP synthase membrane subunit c/vacuolar-type H+-ATPase subunit K
MLLRRHRLVACIAGALPIGVIVGSYLWLFFPPPNIFGTMPAFAAMIMSITISSLVAVGVIGYVLLLTLSRPDVLGSLRSRGLKILNNE